MAGKYGSANVWFLVDGFNVIAAQLQALRYKLMAKTEQTDGLGAVPEAHTPTGMSSFELAQEGAFFDTSAGNIHDALSTSVPTSPQATQRIACAGFAGHTVGETFVGFEGLWSAVYDVLATVGLLQKANAEYRVTGVAEHGVILHELSAETATGNTEGADSVDAGASSAAGGAGYLQVSAISGTGATLNAKVRHSADDVTYADLVTFDQVALADTRDAQRKTVAGTVNRHLASSWTIAGTSPSVTFFIGFARG